MTSSENTARTSVSLDQLKRFLRAKCARLSSSILVRLHQGKIKTGHPRNDRLRKTFFGLKSVVKSDCEKTWEEHCLIQVENEMNGLARALPTYIRGRAVKELQSKNELTVGFLKQAVDDLEAEKRAYLKSPRAVRELLRQRLQNGELTDLAEFEALKRRILYLVKGASNFVEYPEQLQITSLTRALLSGIDFNAVAPEDVSRIIAGIKLFCRGVRTAPYESSNDEPSPFSEGLSFDKDALDLIDQYRDTDLIKTALSDMSHVVYHMVKKNK